METVSNGMAMRAWGNVSRVILIRRRASFVIVNAVCSLMQLFKPTERTTSFVSGLGEGIFNKIVVMCLSVAPGKLSSWIWSSFCLGIRAMLESPKMIISFLMGRFQFEALRFVYGCIRGWR